MLPSHILLASHTSRRHLEAFSKDASGTILLIKRPLAAWRQQHRQLHCMWGGLSILPALSDPHAGTGLIIPYRP